MKQLIPARFGSNVCQRNGRKQRNASASIKYFFFVFHAILAHKEKLFLVAQAVRDPEIDREKEFEKDRDTEIHKLRNRDRQTKRKQAERPKTAEMK